ncbi:cell division protein ZapC domain-containing protein [Paraglaciecola sp. 2405UD69-4]|uniref:cell division protein ZapC domain-containing protein n=1 Tax=Paraglaciecola sp. 2405UD69-4 TaxID=3391836 RepID=UPI0039C8E1F6
MADWFWFSENGQLMLSMGKEWQCTTAYNEQHIVDLPDEKCLFSLRDTEIYLSIGNCLVNSDIQFSEANLTHILINATAALTFHKPVSPKSWLFNEIEYFGANHRLAKIHTSVGEGIVLVLCDEKQLATCMLISKDVQINQKKSLKQFDLVKVAVNRLEPLLVASGTQLTA